VLRGRPSPSRYIALVRLQTNLNEPTRGTALTGKAKLTTRQHFYGHEYTDLFHLRGFTGPHSATVCGRLGHLLNLEVLENTYNVYPFGRVVVYSTSWL